MEEGAVIHIAKRGDEMSISSSTKITVLSPRESIPQNTETNAASIVTLLETGAYSFLGTGDLPTEYERELIPLLPRHVTVYKAGHHGSKTSSGVQLLSYIKPEYAIISAGKNNTYGHPHKETIARLHEYSKEIFSTIEHGDISFSIGNSFSVELEK
jgi:competence protein ComEC